MTVYNVAVSAGHHPGAKGASYQGATEYDEAIKWQAEIVDYLNTKVIDRFLHIRAHLIGTGKLPSKVAEINAIKKCDLAIEIHFNGASDPNINGSEVLYYPGSEKGLEVSRAIYRFLKGAMMNRSRGIKEGWYKMDRPGSVDFDGDVDGDEVIDYFLRKTVCPSVILEPEFIGQIDNIRARQAEGCRAICNGVHRLALEKHELYNLPPEDRPSGIR
jgi:N-acetylmuramoyl-L-alanine amidase